MEDYILRKNEVMHTGEDWQRTYIVDGDVDISNAIAVCKIRNKLDAVLCEAVCEIVGNSIVVSISSADTLSIPRAVRQGRYDVFLIMDTGQTHKLVMGNIDIIHDVSMH